jgi:Flp pilus assembly protein TadG
MKGLAHSLRTQLASDDGGSAVEFAVSCTILLAVLVGVCQMSLGLYAYQFTADAARQATRYAMVRGSTSCTNTPSLTNCNATTANITSYVRGLGYTGITSANVTVSTSWCAASTSTPTTWSSCSSGTSNSPGNLVKVLVTYPVTFQVPFCPKVSLSLSSTSQMVISQ